MARRRLQCRRLFVSPLSTFCDSWRNEFNYNRAVSNRNEFAENSWCAKYTASGGRRAHNRRRGGVCLISLYRARNLCQTLKLDLCARARPALVCDATKRNRRVGEWESIPRSASHGAHMPPISRSAQTRIGVRRKIGCKSGPGTRPTRRAPRRRRRGRKRRTLRARRLEHPARTPRIGRNVACPSRPAPAKFTISPRSPRNWPLCIPGPANSFTARS